MSLNIMDELVKSLLQLIVIGVFGGAVAWFYSRLQKNWELKIRVLRKFSEIHGRFIALRYEFNSFYIQWKGKRSAKFHPLSEDEMRVERWKYFQQACALIGEIQGLQSVMTEVFPATAEDIGFLFSKYQDWRRRIQADRPILQNINGKNEEAYNELRHRYKSVIRHMRKKL